MNKPTWIITGATSAISKAFAHVVAKQGCPVVLVGRNEAQMQRQASDIGIRYQVPCEIIMQDFQQPVTSLLAFIKNHQKDLALFIGHSQILDNSELNSEQIQSMVQTNVLSTIQLIHTFLHKTQIEQRLIFLSSVAACRGRGKNSLYGASKAAVEVYLQGLQQQAPCSVAITIARLGYIDTRQTYGLPHIFYAASPEKAADTCYRANKQGKPLVYYPVFWRGIMALLRAIPFMIYRKMRDV